MSSWPVYVMRLYLKIKEYAQRKIHKTRFYGMESFRGGKIPARGSNKQGNKKGSKEKRCLKARVIG